MGLYFIQVSYKAFVYAVKLKCEVGILNRLVDFVKSASGGSGAANGPSPGLHDDGQCDHHRRFQNFHSFQLSSQVEREWETTLRNTFGVALVDEEKKGSGAVATAEQQQQPQRGGSSRASLAIATPLPPSPDPALMAGEKRARSSGGSSSSNSSSRKRRGAASETKRKRNKYRQVPELTLLDTFGGSQRSRSRNSIGSMDGSPGSDGIPHPDRRSSFGSGSGAETAAVAISEAGSRLSLSSSSLRRPGGDLPMEGLQGSGLSLGSVRDI